MYVQRYQAPTPVSAVVCLQAELSRGVCVVVKPVCCTSEWATVFLQFAYGFIAPHLDPVKTLTLSRQPSRVSLCRLCVCVVTGQPSQPRIPSAIFLAEHMAKNDC